MRRRGRRPIPPDDVCDGTHPGYKRCTDPTCYLVPRQCPGDIGHEDRCLDPNCTNVRGWNRMISSLSGRKTLKQFRDAVYLIICHGPPGTHRERELQKKRFSGEAAFLVRDIIDTCRPKVEDFVNRWRTGHMPGQP